MRNILFINLLLLVTTCFGSGIGEANGHSEKRALPYFNALCNTSCLDIEYVQSNEFKVLLVMDEDIAENVHTEVGSSTLNIYVKGRIALKSTDKYRIIVYAPVIVDMRNVGPGNVDLGDITCPSLYVENSGAGNVWFTYARYNDLDSYRDLEIKNSGSGFIHFECYANTVRIENSGTGEIVAETGETENLIVKSTGSGGTDILALSAERANISNSGSGDVFAYVSGLVYASRTGSGYIILSGDAPITWY